MIVTSRTRQSQPVGPVEINWRHPLLRDADIVFDGVRPLVNRTRFQTQGTGALAQRQTSKGIGAEVSASTAARLSYLVPQPSATSPWTVAAIVTPLVLATGGEANGVTLIGMVDDAFALDRGIYLAPSTFAWRGYLYDGASKSADSARAAAVGRTDTVIVGYNGSQVTVSVDGGYQAATAASNAGYDAYNVNRRFSVGAAAGTACTNGSTFAVSLVVRAQRYWSAAEQAEFVENPWRIFAPVRRPVFFAAGGGVYDVALSEAASSSDSLGASGALTSALAEAASAADVVSAAAAFAAAMSEAATVGDSSAGSTVRAGALGEAASVGDALTASATLAVSISEAVTASDVISSSGALLAALSEAASAADAIDGSVGAATYSATLAEAASAGDAWSSAAVIAGAIVEAVTAGDTVASIATMAAAITEAATAADQVSSAATMAAALSDAVTAGDAWSGSVGAAVLTASLAEAVTAGDVFAALELLARFGVRGARGVSVQANARRAQLQRSVRRN